VLVPLPPPVALVVVCLLPSACSTTTTAFQPSSASQSGKTVRLPTPAVLTAAPAAILSPQADWWWTIPQSYGLFLISLFHRRRTDENSSFPTTTTDCSNRYSEIEIKSLSDQ